MIKHGAFAVTGITERQV